MSGQEGKPPVSPPPEPQRRWTRPEDYIDLGRLWRRSSDRHRRRMEPRTEPENPRLMLTTLPFLFILLILMVVAATVILTAIPGRNRPQPAEQRPTVERGTAPPGWLDGSEPVRR